METEANERNVRKRCPKVRWSRLSRYPLGLSAPLFARAEMADAAPSTGMQVDEQPVPLIFEMPARAYHELARALATEASQWC